MGGLVVPLLGSFGVDYWCQNQPRSTYILVDVTANSGRPLVEWGGGMWVSFKWTSRQNVGRGLLCLRAQQMPITGRRTFKAY